MRTKGFTLIELMIVVAIIAIIAAIAIPNLIRSRIQSNESAAISNLKTILGAQIAYNAARGQYADSFDLLTQESTAGGPPFLEGDWTGVKQGYVYTLAADDPTVDFQCNADPQAPGQSGERYFFINSSGTIRYSTSGQADETSTPLGEQE